MSSCRATNANAILGGVGTFVAPTPIGVVFANF